MYPLQGQGDLLSVTFNPETAEIRLSIVTNIRRHLRCNHQRAPTEWSLVHISI